MGQCEKINGDNNKTQCALKLSNGTIEQVCGKEEDIIYCYSRGVMICCFNNLPCLENNHQLNVVVDFAYDVAIALEDQEEKEGKRKKRKGNERKKRHKFKPVRKKVKKIKRKKSYRKKAYRKRQRNKPRKMIRKQ